MSAVVPVGLGVDLSALAGDVNIFAILKFAMSNENGRAGSEFKLTRDARSNSRRSMPGIIGVDGQAGSLTPGKRADIIMVATGPFNMAGGVGPCAPRGRGQGR